MAESPGSAELTPPVNYKGMAPLRSPSTLVPHLHDEADDLGDRLEMFGRDGFVDIDSCKERAGKRRVLDDRDVVLLGKVADAEGDVVGTLGEAERGRHGTVVLERHREV